MVEELVEAWRVNHTVTLRMLDALSDDALKATLSKRGGRDIARQLAHLHESRCYWLRKGDSPVGLIHFDKGESPSREKIREALGQSALALEGVLRRACTNDRRVAGFKRNVVVFLGYLIAHESHHRGGILLTAKQCGQALDNELRWGIWDWGRMEISGE